MRKASLANMVENSSKKNLNRLASDLAAATSDEDFTESSESSIEQGPKNMGIKVFRSQIFVKLLKMLSDHDPSINSVMYNIVTEKPWSNLI